MARDLPLSQPMQHIPEGVKGLTSAGPTAGEHRVLDPSGLQGRREAGLTLLLRYLTPPAACIVKKLTMR